MTPAGGAEIRGAFAFLDLAGFTSFTAEHGDEAAIELVELFRERVLAVLPDDGRIVNRIGDGLLVHFDDASTAVPTLLGLCHRCLRDSTDDRPLWVRSGVHVGSARSLGDDLIGHDVNVAARIGDLAAADEVLVSESARAASSGAISFEELGPVFVKGISDPLRLYRAAAGVSATNGP